MKSFSLSCALLIGILAILSISHVSCEANKRCKPDIANYQDVSSQTPVSDEEAKKEARKVDLLLDSWQFKAIERKLKQRVLSSVMEIYSLINDLNKILLELKALSPHTAFGEAEQIQPREPSSELILKAMRELTKRETIAKRSEFAKQQRQFQQQAKQMQDDERAKLAQEAERARQAQEDGGKQSLPRTSAAPTNEAPSGEAAVAAEAAATDDYAKRLAEMHTPEEQEQFEKWMENMRKKYGDIDFGPRKQELMERYMNEKQSGKPLDKALEILEKAYEDEYEKQKKERTIAENDVKKSPEQQQKFQEGEEVEEKRRQRKLKKEQSEQDDFSTEGIMNSLGNALSGLFS